MKTYAEYQRDGFAAEMCGDKVAALEAYREADAVYRTAYAKSPNNAQMNLGDNSCVSATIRRLSAVSHA
jgi:hypothetical protein